MTKETTRVLELLKRFNDGQTVCIEQLLKDPVWLNDTKGEQMSEKSIRRDLDVLKEKFPESFELIRGGKGEKGCYRAITKQTFENILTPEMVSLLVLTFNIAQKSDLFDNLNLSAEDKKILDNKIKEFNRAYEFKNKPFETRIDDRIIFKKLENSIKNQKHIILEYPTRGDTFEKIEVQPYKILFMNENFYLACAVDSEFEFSIFRVSKIKSIEDTKKTYHKNLDIVDFIKDIQTPFASYKKEYRAHLIEVKLEIDRSKAYFFKAKKFLKSQEILETKENGNIVVSYRVTKTTEVDELVKRWLPYAKVVEPKEFKERIEGELRGYLSVS